MENTIFFHDVLGIENIGISNNRRKMVSEFVKGRMRTVVAGFDFYWTYFLSLRDQKINFHMILAVFII